MSAIEIVRYKFDASDWKNIINDDDELTSFNDPASVTGVRGKAAHYEAALEQYSHADYSSNFDLSDWATGFTITLWVKCDSLAAGAAILYKGAGPAGSKDWALMTVGSKFFWYTETPASGPATVTATTFGTIPLDEWCFVCVRLDGKAYISVNNGAFDESLFDGGLVRDTPGQGMYVGSGYSNEGVGATFDRWFDGAVDDLRIWRGLLSDDEITEVYRECTTFSGFDGDPALLARTISTDLLDSLASGATSLCLCVLVTRSDDVTLGFTTHDEDLTFDGVTYEALSSVQATTLRQQSGTGIDNMDVTGLLSSDRITESDLRAQRFDGAQIKLYVVDWSNIGDPCLVLKGRFGELNLTDGQYRAEIRSLMQRYAQQTGKLTSPTCRWLRFCDSNCALDIADFTFPAEVDSLGTVSRVFYASATGPAFPSVGQFAYGVARGTSGDNDGIERELKLGDMTGTSRRFELQESFPYPIQVGDTFDIEQGCDRTKEACIVYNNIVNFGGEPYVPGTDKLQRVGRHKT